MITVRNTRKGAFVSEKRFDRSDGEIMSKLSVVKSGQTCKVDEQNPGMKIFLEQKILVPVGNESIKKWENTRKK